MNLTYSNICLYHSYDFDGLMSAAIVNKFYNGDVILKGVDYSDDYTDLYTYLEHFERIIIVDFCFPDMIEFISKYNNITNNRIIWIDHHKTSIELCENNQLIDANTLGIRSIDNAACYLTWKYFFHNDNIPYPVELLAAYDIWDLNKFPNNDVLNFQYGLKELVDFKHPFKSDIFKKLLKKSLFWKKTKITNKIINMGKYICSYQKNISKKVQKISSFEIKFHGFRTIVCNTPIRSFIYDSLDKKYDIYMTYYFNGKHYIITIWSDIESEIPIDVSIIAKQYGGGGHKHVAGFIIDKIEDIISQ